MISKTIGFFGVHNIFRQTHIPSPIRNLSIQQHKDLIRAADRRQPMRHRDAGHAFGGALQCLLDQRFGGAVQVRSGLAGAKAAGPGREDHPKKQAKHAKKPCKKRGKSMVLSGNDLEMWKWCSGSIFVWG